eukprot:365449-Chlamydomonas_euryale.AAC.3
MQDVPGCLRPQSPALTAATAASEQTGDTYGCIHVKRASGVTRLPCVLHASGDTFGCINAKRASGETRLPCVVHATPTQPSHPDGKGGSTSCGHCSEDPLCPVTPSEHLRR